MYVHECKKRIRYAETDQMGYLYYGNYAILYEIGRTEAMRSLGVHYSLLEKEAGIMMPVVSVESRYLAPLYYDEEARIITKLLEIPDKLICFHHEIVNEQNKIVHTAQVKLFFINMETQKRVSIPSKLREALIPFFNS
ncbi:MAG: acyl-CoA thioesterase [Saprospiraceae bacterium]|nr:acyl-CoA thioesterase [Saprospiraceae bacterium]MCB9328203.1 acyl-CoA thioesterase [Lewinellaceae bacterium]